MFTAPRPIRSGLAEGPEPRRAAIHSRVRPGRGRSGMSMMLVIVSLGISVTVAYAFLQTQAATIQIGDNGTRQDLALQAAQAGAAVALQDLQSATWAGVSTTLTRKVGTVAGGNLSYSVQYLTSSGATPGETALRVLVRSTGTWLSTSDSTQRADRIVEVVSQLQPRIPGRTIVSGDLAAAEDVADNPANYDQIQSYVLWGRATGNTLVMEPGDRIEGNIWINDNPVIYGDPNWDSDVRDDFMKAVGTRFSKTVSGQKQYYHPHPLSGAVTFKASPSSSQQSDLADINVAWSRITTMPSSPTIDFTAWQTYRVYTNGFSYSAEVVGSSLQNVTLRPSAANPLGIFYRNGSIMLGDNVTIQGTLVSTSQIAFNGSDIHVVSYNYRTDAGTPLTTQAENWPRLPAIVANSLIFDRSTSSTVEGAILLKNTFGGAGGTFEYRDVTDVQITGTATAQPAQQPWSQVQVLGTLSLSSVGGNANYAIWLDRGNSGSWYPIESVDTTNRTLKVWGEVNLDSATTFKIRRNRKKSVTIRGPMVGESFNVQNLPEWVLTDYIWDLMQARWDATNNSLKAQKLPTIDFSSFIEYPGAWYSIWASPYTHQTYGLNLEPTFHITHIAGTTSYRWSPPLFTSYQATGTNADYAGFRWKVVNWKEQP